MSQSARAVSAIRGVSFSISSPGDSDSTSCAPPAPSSGRMATISTTMPIPPSHWVSCRHISIEREWVSNEMSPRTVAPVVVNPLMLSNSAFVGWATVPSPARRYGSVPSSGTTIQARPTKRNPSATSISGSGRRRSSATPATSATAIVARNGRTGSPYTSAVPRGNTSGTARSFSTLPRSATVVRTSTRRVIRLCSLGATRSGGKDAPVSSSDGRAPRWVPVRPGPAVSATRPLGRRRHPTPRPERRDGRLFVDSRRLSVR